MEERDVLAVLSRVGAVITGSHVVYTSGRHGRDYVNKDALYPHTRETALLCRVLAERFASDGIEVVVAPAVGGIALSRELARSLGEMCFREVLTLFAEREEHLLVKAEKEMAPFRDYPFVTINPGTEIVTRLPGFTLKRGYEKLVYLKKALVVEDVLTTGGSAKKTVEAVRLRGGRVVAVGALCNRGGVSADDVGAPRLESLVSVNLDSWSEAECPLCAEGVPVNVEVGKGRDFLARAVS